ncbi:hypothetical protein BRD18_00200 [Halobacteriales archaeon SW_7_71_33]|nr:MAG: hypothetical protein BRD18_00200 [Halobacteriales archaeon SW_7_71_33]
MSDDADGEEAGLLPVTTRCAVEYVPVGPDTTTVVTDAPSEGDGLAARFDCPDAGTPGSVDFPEVVSVVRAYNGGDPEISFGDVVAVIRAYNGGDWDAVG